MTSEDPETVYEQALALVEANKFDEADKLLVRLQSLRPQTILDHGLKARVLMAQKAYESAIHELDAIPDDHPLASWARLRKGQLYRQLFQFRKSESELTRAAALAPDQPEARRELVYVLGLQLRRAELNENFRALSRITTLNAKEIWVWCMVRDLVWWVPEEQIPQLKKAIAADPGDTWSILALAEVLSRTGAVVEALAELHKIEKHSPAALAKIVEIELAQDRQDQIQALLSKIPDDEPTAAIVRGRLALAAGDAKTAIHYFEIADKADPGRRPVMGDLGRAWTLAGDAGKGKKYAGLAAKVDVLNNLLLKSETTILQSGVEQWRAFAQACLAADRLHEARAWLALIIQKMPLDTDAQAQIFQIDKQLNSIGIAEPRTQ